jgi:hypothetical protein
MSLACSRPIFAMPTNPYAVLCVVMKSLPAEAGGFLGAALGREWCKETYCKPPSGHGH